MRSLDAASPTAAEPAGPGHPQGQDETRWSIFLRVIFIEQVLEWKSVDEFDL
ncbi:MAG: hypothetical protein ACYC3I_20990 [Gemmataceae bacterium]